MDLNFPNTPRVPSTIINPIIEDGTDYPSTSFSLATNIIDFGIRAFHLEKNSFGTGNLVQLFPPIKLDAQGTFFLKNFLPLHILITKKLLIQHSTNSPMWWM